MQLDSSLSSPVRRPRIREAARGRASSRAARLGHRRVQPRRWRPAARPRLAHRLGVRPDAILWQRRWSGGRCHRSPRVPPLELRRARDRSPAAVAAHRPRRRRRQRERCVRSRRDRRIGAEPAHERPRLLSEPRQRPEKAEAEDGGTELDVEDNEEVRQMRRRRRDGLERVQDRDGRVDDLRGQGRSLRQRRTRLKTLTNDVGSAKTS